MGFQYAKEPKRITMAEFLAVHPWRVRVNGECRYHTSHQAGVTGLGKHDVVDAVEWFDGKTWREM